MDLKRVIREKTFWLAVALAFAGLLLGTDWPEWKKETVFPSGTFLKLATESLKSKTVLFLLPVTGVLPWSGEYLRERQWNFLRFLILRKGKKWYVLDRVVTTALSGMLVWILASFIQALFFFLLFFWKEEVFLSIGELLREYFTFLFRVSLTASVAAGFGGVCGVAGNSVYMAAGLPFVTFFFLLMVKERYLENLYCLDPWEWIKGEAFWGSGQRGLWIFLLVLWGSVLILHGILLDRRLEEV